MIYGQDQVRIHVYTRPVNPDSYPEGLARSIHFACETDRNGREPFNRNYGILFAEGMISGDNTIIPMGISAPGIFHMEDGIIGITGTRVHENGEPDETSIGKVFLWITRDLIHFDPAGWAVPGKDVPAALPDMLDLDRSIAETALRWWSPIIHTGTSVPETVRVRTPQELDQISALLTYSDGSVREKKVVWETDLVLSGAYRSASGFRVHAVYRFH